jgi:hypothetical protein
MLGARAVRRSRRVDRVGFELRDEEWTLGIG